jgi:hypothetical protein
MAIVGRVPGKGLTPEAAQALQMSDPIVTASGDDEEDNVFDVPIGAPLFDEFESGDGIEDSRLRQKVEDVPPARDAKPGIPALDEWLDFFSRILLRVMCDWYIEFAFRGVDENSLTDREIDRIQMTEEERKRISVPLAELSHKSKFMRKHGRTIIASGGAFDAIVALGAWTRRVQRIASRHKTRTVPGRVFNERTGQGSSEASGSGYAGANGGNVAGGVTIINPGG